jgi:hypothetical protein
VNPYRRIGFTAGTPEALQLAERLAAWHDQMVAHERRPGSTCGDECPHADARELWREAQAVFGPHAHELRFLALRAAPVASRRAARASRQPDGVQWSG